MPARRRPSVVGLGEVYLYVEGPPTADPRCRPPAGDGAALHGLETSYLAPGDQHTIAPGIRHWFQASPDGAVVTEYSAASRDETDAHRPAHSWRPE